MVEKTVKKCILLGVFILTIFENVKSQRLKTNETEARAFLNCASDEMFTYFDQLVDREFYFDYNFHLNNYKDTFWHNARESPCIYFVKQIVQDAKVFDFMKFKDHELRHAFEQLVQLADEKIIGPERYSRLSESLKELDFLPHYKEIGKFKEGYIRVSYDHVVEEILSNSPNETVIEHYWTAWRRATGHWAKKNLILTLEAIRDAALLNDIPVESFWSRGFNITDMENIMFDIRSLNFELHGFIRILVQKKYGESTIGPDRLIPDHLYRRIIRELMTNDSVIEELFPLESLPLPNIENIDSERIYGMAEDFYYHLGFEKYPSSVWGDRIKLIQDEKTKEKNVKADEDEDYDYYNEPVTDPDDDYGEDDGKQEEEDEDANGDYCMPRVIHKSPKILLKFCDVMDILEFHEAFVHMGYIYSAKEMKGLPAYFFGSPQNLDYAIGKAAILTATTHEYMRETSLISYNDVIPKKAEMNRLIRMAIKHLLYLPLDFIHTILMVDLLKENVEPEVKDVNGRYWNYMHEYIGVRASTNHYTKTFDLPYNLYREMNDNKMSMEFTTEILSFQIYQKLCEISGEYPKKPLHLCVVRGKEAGDVLKKMMQLGRSKPFWEVLAIMFPENPKVSADGILEYFKILKRMLVRRNKKANLIYGWDYTLLPDRS